MSQKIELESVQEYCWAYLNEESVEVIERYNNYIWLVKLQNKQIVMALEDDLHYPHIYE